MNKDLYNKITDLLLFAVGFQRGDKLNIRVDFDQREVALAVSEKAYKQGAAFVKLDYSDAVLQAQAIAGTEEKFIFPDYLQSIYRETTQPGWKLIGIYSESEADVFDGLDTKRSSAYFQAFSENRKVRMKAIMDNRIPWTLTYLPSKTMAKKAFPQMEAEKAVLKYWEAVIAIMRLDLDDPVQFWKDKMIKDKKRSDFMNNLDASYLHFKGPGTDFKVGLAKMAQWIGGFDETTDGKTFIANLPTDEIFTSPDWRKAEGRVTLTKPFVMHQNLGPIPQKAWFEFSNGKVVDYGAVSGKDSLDAFFKIDQRACYLGEVALVDPQSPFAQQGITYYNGLYDENAACHLALGKAYPFTLKERNDFSDEELLELGLNISNVHEDMMVGAKDVDVTALLPDGSSKEIIKNGKFLI
ncbi:MAG: aminopeptidase [Spirochaetaceae bacterium]|jgi:aminopeptidase|nr:aminopeptidase [Spirochaetaceae bacterium]